MRICTCLIRDIGHVGRVMFDCFFIMFQRFFKVLILICSIPKFFFLQGLLRREKKELNQTQNIVDVKTMLLNWFTFLLFSGRSSSLGGGGWVSLGLGGGGGVGSSSSSISERFKPSSTESVVITLGSCSFLHNSQANKCISKTTVFKANICFPCMLKTAGRHWRSTTNKTKNHNIWNDSGPTNTRWYCSIKKKFNTFTDFLYNSQPTQKVTTYSFLFLIPASRHKSSNRT